MVENGRLCGPNAVLLWLFGVPGPVRALFLRMWRLPLLLTKVTFITLLTKHLAAVFRPCWTSGRTSEAVVFHRFWRKSAVAQRMAKTEKRGVLAPL